MSQLTIKENFINQLQTQFNVDLKSSNLEQRYQVLASIVQQRLQTLHMSTQDQIKKHQLKKTIYFSMEFLMGRMITNNLYSLGIYDDIKALFEEHHLDINEVENYETDAGLGNGGLGRLAACFLDSAAALKLPLYGNSIRYSKGFFVQTIEERQGFGVGCIEAVAHSNGYINDEKLKELAIPLLKSGYGNYLMSLID